MAVKPVIFCKQLKSEINPRRILLAVHDKLKELKSGCDNTCNLCLAILTVERIQCGCCKIIGVRKLILANNVDTR